MPLYSISHAANIIDYIQYNVEKLFQCLLSCIHVNITILFPSLWSDVLLLCLYYYLAVVLSLGIDGKVFYNAQVNIIIRD